MSIERKNKIHVPLSVRRDRNINSLLTTKYNKIPIYKGFSEDPAPTVRSSGIVGDEPGMIGDVIIDRVTGSFCWHDAAKWNCIRDITLSGLACSPESSPPSIDLVSNGIGPDLVIRNLAAGPGVILSDAAGCVEISSDITLTGVTCSPESSPPSIDLVSNGVGPDLAIKNLAAGPGVILSDADGCVEISSDITLTGVTCSPESSPPSVDLVSNGVGPDLAIKNLAAGPGVILSDADGCVEISSDITLTGVTCSPESSPPSVDLVSNGVGPDLAIKNLAAGPGVILSDADGCVEISSDITLTGVTCSPESSPPSVDLVSNGVGPDLAIKNLSAGSGITLSDTDGCVEISSDAITLTGISCSPESSPPSVDLVSNGVGPDLAIKNLSEGQGITLTDTGNCVEISANIDTITLTGISCSPESSPPSVDLVSNGVGPDLTIKNLSEGAGITLTDTGSCIQISADNAAITLTGISCSPESSPPSVDLVSNGVGPDLTIKNLSEGQGITLTDTGSCVEISSQIADIKLRNQSTLTTVLANDTATLKVGAPIDVSYNTGDITVDTINNLFEFNTDGYYSVTATITWEYDGNLGSFTYVAQRVLLLPYIDGISEGPNYLSTVYDVNTAALSFSLQNSIASNFCYKFTAGQQLHFEVTLDSVGYTGAIFAVFADAAPIICTAYFWIHYLHP